MKTRLTRIVLLQVAFTLTGCTDQQTFGEKMSKIVQDCRGTITL